MDDVKSSSPLHVSISTKAATSIGSIVLRRGPIATLVSGVLIARLAFGCSSGDDGTLGQRCANESGSYLGTLTCNAGLVCNLGHTPALCEEPHAQGAGGRCSDRIDCQVNLACTNYQCTSVLSLGEACPPTPTGTGCADDLVCMIDANDPVGHCAAAGGEGQPCRPSDSSCDPGFICTKLVADGVHGFAHCSVAADAGAG